jgi:hypothetical protein
MTDLSKTQHYTTQAEKIISNLIDYIPGPLLFPTLIEPFCGKGDLLTLFPHLASSWELYDIDPQNKKTLRRDTLLDPPDYTDKYVITNPPFLAKNKATEDKGYFSIPNHLEDDLYKVFLSTLIQSNPLGGILILPINFLADEHTQPLRTKFFSKFKIDYLNVFTEPVFSNTTSTIISFAFSRAASEISIFNLSNIPPIPISIDNIP